MHDLVIILAGMTAALLDPIKWLIILVISISLLEKKWAVWKIVIITTLTGAIVSETILTTMQVTRTFGQGVILHLLASFILSFAGIWLARKYFIKSKT